MFKFDYFQVEFFGLFLTNCFLFYYKFRNKSADKQGRFFEKVGLTI